MSVRQRLATRCSTGSVLRPSGCTPTTDTATMPDGPSTRPSSSSFSRINCWPRGKPVMAQTPADFAQYWQHTLEALAGYPASPEIDVLRLRSTDFATLYAVRLTSLGPYRLFGYLSMPTGDGPFPAIYYVPKYQSVLEIISQGTANLQRSQYITFALAARGQRNADTPYAAVFPGLLTDGIDQAASYIFRGIVADSVRGLEFLLTRRELDTTRVVVFGNDMALITAALHPGATHVVTTPALFYNAAELAPRTQAYPLEELNDYLRAFPTHAEAVRQQGHSVFRDKNNTEERQRCPGLSRKAATGSRDVGFARPAHESNDRIAQRCHRLRDTATTHLRPIFVEGHIADPMGFILDVPVAPHQRQQPCRVRTLRRQTGDARDSLLAHLARLFDDDLSFQVEDLRQARPVTVAHQHITGVQPSLFDATVPRVHRLCHRAGLPGDRCVRKHRLNLFS